MWVKYPITLNEDTLLYSCGICFAAVEVAFLDYHQEWHDKAK